MLCLLSQGTLSVTADIILTYEKYNAQRNNFVAPFDLISHFSNRSKPQYLRN